MVSLTALRRCGELFAILIGLGGAALCMNLTHADQPARGVELNCGGFMPTERVAPPRAQASLSCDRGYSDVRSLAPTLDDIDAVVQACIEGGGIDCDSSTWLSRETAICFAEEHYLGEGSARDAHLDFDPGTRGVLWAILGSEGEVVTVAASKIP